jgi:hypothetical protein
MGVISDAIDALEDWCCDLIKDGIKSQFDGISDLLTDTFSQTTGSDGLVSTYLTSHPANFTGGGTGGTSVWTTIETLCNNVVVPIAGFMGQINKLLIFAKSDRNGFEKMMKDKCDGSILAKSETTEARIEQIKARLSEIDVYVQGLFESKIRGEIDGDMFCTFSEKYRTEKSELNTELENLFLTLQNIKKKTGKSAVLGTSVNKYDTISE